MNNYRDDALMYLHDRAVVLWVLAGLRRESLNYDEVARKLHQYANLRPVLENALVGKFPSDEEFKAPVPEFGNEPLLGEICHVLGNRSWEAKQFAKRCFGDLKSASDGQYIRAIQQAWNTWISVQVKWEQQQMQLAPIQEQFLTRLDRTTELGLKSGSATTTNPLLREYMAEYVNPLHATQGEEWAYMLSRRWFNVTYTTRIKVRYFNKDKNRSELRVEINTK